MIACLPILIQNNRLVTAFLETPQRRSLGNPYLPFELIRAIDRLYGCIDARELDRLLGKCHGMDIYPFVVPKGVNSRVVEKMIHSLLQTLHEDAISKHTLEIFGPMFFNASSLNMVLIYACVPQTTPAEMIVFKRALQRPAPDEVCIMGAHLRHVEEAWSRLSLNPDAESIDIVMFIQDMWFKIPRHILAWAASFVKEHRAGQIVNWVENNFEIPIEAVVFILNSLTFLLSTEDIFRVIERFPDHRAALLATQPRGRRV